MCLPTCMAWVDSSSADAMAASEGNGNWQCDGYAMSIERARASANCEKDFFRLTFTCSSVDRHSRFAVRVSLFGWKHTPKRQLKKIQKCAPPYGCKVVIYYCSMLRGEVAAVASPCKWKMEIVCSQCSDTNICENCKSNCCILWRNYLIYSIELQRSALAVTATLHRECIREIYWTSH